MYSNEFKYIYKSSRYEISDIIDFVIECRILKISPYVLNKEKGYKSGTVSTWYKNNNELRILYSLYNMPIDEINKKFENYYKYQVVEFNQQVINLVLECRDIDNSLKDEYIKKINNFNLSLNTENDNKEKYSNTNNVIKVITQNKEIWNAFLSTNKDKIFEILYNDEKILSALLEQIYE